MSTTPPVKRTMFLSLDALKLATQELSTLLWLCATLDNKRKKEASSCLPNGVMTQVLHPSPTPKTKKLKTTSRLVEDDNTGHVFLEIARPKVKKEPSTTTLHISMSLGLIWVIQFWVQICIFGSFQIIG